MDAEGLLANFETIADSKVGVNQLRQLILQVALQGGLVPQDPNEPPATALLVDIERERKRLEKQGVLPKAKPLSPVVEEEQPYSLPTKWTWARFGRVADHRLGKMLDKGKNKGELRVYLRNANVRWFAFDLEDLLEMRVQQEKLAEVSLMPGDLVICEGGEPGRCAIWDSDQPVVIQKALHRARPFAGVLSRYLAYCLLCDAGSGRLNEFFTGATIKHFTGKALAAYTVPLPPAKEQHRIVAKVDELMALCDQLEERQERRHTVRKAARTSALEALSSADGPDALASAWNRVGTNWAALTAHSDSIPPLRQAVSQLAVQGKLVKQDPKDEPADRLLERIAEERRRLVEQKQIRKPRPVVPVSEGEDAFGLPDSWQWARLDELAFLITDGTHHTPRYVQSGVPFVSIKDISGGRLEFANVKYIPEHDHEEINRRCNPERDDILFCRIGTLGRPVLVDTDSPFSLFVSVGLIKFSTTNVFPPYLLCALSSPELYRQYETVKAGGSHTNKLNLSVMPGLLVPLPPFAEQRRIVAKVDELMILCDELEARLQSHETTSNNLAAAAVQALAS